MNAIEIKEGDYIDGLGIVQSVRKFETVSASNMRLVEADKKSNYSRKVAAELENCYSNNVDRLTVYGTLGTKTFFSDDTVNVIRFKNVA